MNGCDFMSGSELLKKEDHGFYKYCFFMLIIICLMGVNKCWTLIVNIRSSFPIRELCFSLSSVSSTSLVSNSGKSPSLFVLLILILWAPLLFTYFTCEFFYINFHHYHSLLSYVYKGLWLLCIHTYIIHTFICILYTCILNLNQSLSSFCLIFKTIFMWIWNINL